MNGSSLHTYSSIVTVLGEIPAVQLGPVLMHEHLLADVGVAYAPSPEPGPAPSRVTIDNLGWLRWNANSMRDNLVLDELDIAIQELQSFAAAEGSGVVEVSMHMRLGSPVDMQRISRRTGVHIMLGCGWYVHASHPAYVAQESEDELAARLIQELEHGVDGSDVRATVIGEIGTSATITNRELRCLRASGTAAALTGAAIIVHLDPQAQNALEVVEVLTSRGVAVERIVLGHMDLQDDLGYLRQAADSGANLSFDTFGTECHWNGLWQLRDPTDEERIQRLVHLLEAGFEGRLVLSHDVFLKTLLRRYGGLGYDHLLRRIVPHLQARYGVSQETTRKLLCDNPRRLLVRRNA